MQVASSIRDLADTRVFIVPIGNVSKELLEQCIQQLKSYATVRWSSQRWRSHSEALPSNATTSREASGDESQIYRFQFQLCSQDNNNSTIQLPSSEWESFQLSRRCWGIIGIAQVSEANANQQVNGAKIQHQLNEVSKQRKKQQPLVIKCLVIQDDKTTTNQTERELPRSEKISSQVEEELTSLDIASVEAESVKDEVESSSSYPKQVSRNDMSTYSATGGDSSSDEDKSSVKAPSTVENTLATSSTLTVPSRSSGESNNLSIPLKYVTRKQLLDSSSKDWLSSWLISFATDIHQCIDFWLRRMMTSADLIVSPMDADKAAEKFSKLVRRRASRLDKYFGDFYLMSGNYRKSFMKYSACAAAARANSDWLWLAGAIEGTCACAILLGRDFTTLSGIANVVEIQPENRDLISQVIQHYDEVCKLYRKKRAFFMEMFACLRLANFLSETTRRSEHLQWLQNASEALDKMPNRYPNGVEEEKRTRLLGLIGYAYLQAGCWRKASFYFWREAVGLRRQGDSFAAITIIQQVIRLFGVKGFPLEKTWNHSVVEGNFPTSRPHNMQSEVVDDWRIWPCLVRLALLETASSSRASGHSSLCLWSCFKALETSKYISPWDEMSPVTSEDAKIVAWMLRYPLSVRIKGPCGNFIRVVDIYEEKGEECQVETSLQRYDEDSHPSSPAPHKSPCSSPKKRLSSNPFIYSPFMNRQESIPETVVSDSSRTVCMEKGEEYKFVFELYNELKSTIPLEILEILTCPHVDEKSSFSSEERNADTFSIHSLPFVLAQKEQSVFVTLKPEKIGHFCIVGLVVRLWNRFCVDLSLEESQFVYVEIFSPLPAIDANIMLSSRPPLNILSQDSFSAIQYFSQNNCVFWDGELVTLHIGLQRNQRDPIPSLECKLELQQGTNVVKLEYNEEEMNQQLQKLSWQLTNSDQDRLQERFHQDCRCLLSSTFISPHYFVDNHSLLCKLELQCHLVHSKESQKVQSFSCSYRVKPSMVVTFIGITERENDDTMEETKDSSCYQLVLELHHWMEASINLDITSLSQRCRPEALHLEPNECQRIAFMLPSNLLSSLKQIAKDCYETDSFSNKAIQVLVSQLEFHWECPVTKRRGNMPLRLSSHLSTNLNADLILPRARIEFRDAATKKRNQLFQVPCHVPLQLEIHITNCWWQSFPEDLCLSLKIEQATLGTWTDVMFQGVYASGQWEDVICGNISAGQKVVHSIQLEFISRGSYYLVAYLASSTSPWKTLTRKVPFLVN